MFIRKSVFATAFIAIIVTQGFISFTNEVQAINQPAGMGLRITELQIEHFKVALERFLPHYITFDLDLPKKYDWNLKTAFGLINEHINYSEI